MIRSIGTGKFLGVAGGLEDGVRAIGSDFPTLWGIRPDEEDPSHHRYVKPTSGCLRLFTTRSDLQHLRPRLPPER